MEDYELMKNNAWMILFFISIVLAPGCGSHGGRYFRVLAPYKGEYTAKTDGKVVSHISGRACSRILWVGPLILPLSSEGDLRTATEAAFENALRLDMAIGASTNTMLHVPDIAKEAGFEFDLNRINELSQSTPNLVKLDPSSDYFMDDLHSAGGIPTVMSELKLKGLIHNIATIEGKLFDRLLNAPIKNKKVIRPIENPYSKSGGIAVLYGNLAKKGSVIKTTGLSLEFPSVFEGSALVFDSEQECNDFIAKGNIPKKSVIVIRYEGPVGGPGMPEMLYPTAGISGLGLDNDVALLTDGHADAVQFLRHLLVLVDDFVERVGDLPGQGEDL